MEVILWGRKQVTLFWVTKIAFNMKIYNLHPNWTSSWAYNSCSACDSISLGRQFIATLNLEKKIVATTENESFSCIASFFYNDLDIIFLQISMVLYFWKVHPSTCVWYELKSCSFEKNYIRIVYIEFNNLLLPCTHVSYLNSGRFFLSIDQTISTCLDEAIKQI